AALLTSESAPDRCGAKRVGGQRRGRLAATQNSGASARRRAKVHLDAFSPRRCRAREHRSVEGKARIGAIGGQCGHAKVATRLATMDGSCAGWVAAVGCGANLSAPTPASNLHIMPTDSRD